MTRSSRTLNRIIVALCGLALIAAAALVLVPDARRAVAWRPDLTASPVLWATAGAMALLVLLSLAWIATRGRGRARSAIRAAGVDIDTRLVSSLLSAELAASPDILSVGARSFVRRAQRLIEVTVVTRRHPDLAAVRSSIATAMDAVDRTIGAPAPMVVHITTGIRTSFARERVAR